MLSVNLTAGKKYIYFLYLHVEDVVGVVVVEVEVEVEVDVEVAIKIQSSNLINWKIMLSKHGNICFKALRCHKQNCF